VDHDGRRGNTVQALARWRHPVAPSEALDVLHQVMHPASCRLISMAIEIPSNLPALFVVADLLLPITIAKIHMLWVPAVVGGCRFGSHF